MLGDSGKDSYLLWPVADKERRYGKKWLTSGCHSGPTKDITTIHLERTHAGRARTSKLHTGVLASDQELIWSEAAIATTALLLHPLKKAKKQINNFPIVNKRIKVKTELAFISSSSQVAGLYTVLSHTPFWGVSTVQKHPAQGSVLWDNLYSHSDNSHCCSDLIWLLIHANSLEVGRMTKHD